MACQIGKWGQRTLGKGKTIRNSGGKSKYLNIIDTHISVFPCLTQQPQSRVQKHEEP